MLDGGQLADLGARALSRLAGEEATVRPEDTLREAGISTKRQARYKRRALARFLARTQFGVGDDASKVFISERHTRISRVRL